MWSEIIIFGSIYALTYAIFWYRQRVHYYNHFKRNGISGPKPSLFYGNFWELTNNGDTISSMAEWTKKYGNVFGYYFGMQRHLVISDLDIIENIFIKNSSNFINRQKFAINSRYLVDSVISLRDDHWRNVRKMISPTFSNAKIAQPVISGAIEDCIDTFFENLERLEEAKATNDEDKKDAIVTDIYVKMQSFTLDVISRTSLDLNDDVYKQDNRFIKAVRDFFKHSSNAAIQIALFIPLFRTILAYVNNYVTAGKMIDMIVRQIKKRITDLVKENAETGKVDAKANVLKSLMQQYAQGNITQDEFIGNVLIIILAGYETTANAVTYMWYLLAKHPEIQERLRDDVKQYGSKSQYLDMVWMEALRYYPPVTLFLVREAAVDCVINGVKISAGDHIQVPVWEIHHREDVWPDPWKFDPERFSSENKKTIKNTAFLTFGLGPRICLGVNFANYEAKAITTRLLMKYRLENCEQTPDPLKFVTPTVIINPADPVVLKFVKLDDSQ